MWNPGASGTLNWNPGGTRNPNLDLLGPNLVQEPSGPDFLVSDPRRKVLQNDAGDGVWSPFTWNLAQGGF